MHYLMATILLCSGCVGTGLPGAGGSDGGAVASVSDAGPPTASGQTMDAASPDLTVPPPTTGDCAGSPIAGTCVETFFAPMLACFHGSGACTKSTGPGGSINLCFADGAKVFGIPAPVTTSEIGWMAPGQCFMKSIVTVDSAGVTNFQYITQNGPQLNYDEHTGDAKCPDGTVVHIGPNDGCGALGALLAPWRTAMCSNGVCQ